MISNLKCPRCRCDAIYSYGRIKSGKQRYLCLLCNRQFVTDRSRPIIEKRPLCPLCHGKMHVYRREKGNIRFRCADYPNCKGYTKTIA
ncbi:MAG: IS1 family transposase [Thermodesulfobacteriota bacterium]|nr:IS1 family transposase [Thermodesulfobacteriota bacterium]